MKLARFLDFAIEYYMLGIMCVIFALVAGRPRLSWRWLLIPLAAIFWPYFVWRAIDGYKGGY